MLIKSGDIVQLSNHVLGCGSSTNVEFVKKVIGDRSIQSIQTDPPYGVSVVESSLNPTKHKKIANDHLQSDEEYVKFSCQWLDAVKHYLAKKNSVYIFNSDKMIFALRQAMVQSDFKFAFTSTN